MSKSTTNAIVAFLAGASAGAITGILFAPDKGTKTRKKVNKKAKKVSAEMKDNVGSKMDDLKSYVSDFVNDVKERFSKIEADMNEQKEKVEKATAQATGKK